MKNKKQHNKDLRELGTLMERQRGAWSAGRKRISGMGRGGESKRHGGLTYVNSPLKPKRRRGNKLVLRVISRERRKSGKNKGMHVL